jgi:hypothetical protein
MKNRAPTSYALPAVTVTQRPIRNDCAAEGLVFVSCAEPEAGEPWKSEPWGADRPTS